MKESDMDQQNAELIEEYKTLRAEILQILNIQDKIQTIWFGIIIPTFTFALLQKQPWVCLLVWIFNWYSWIKSKETINAITRIGTYISIFIEPKTQGLRWETSLVNIDYKEFNYNKKKYNYKRIIIPHALISLSSIIASIYFLYISKNYMGIFLLAIFFIVNLIYFYKERGYYGWWEEKVHWMGVWKSELDRQTKDGLGITQSICQPSLNPGEEDIRKKGWWHFWK
jgi:hypothetical protein